VLVKRVLFLLNAALAIIVINDTKFLGLELDKNISWKNHVQKKILLKSSSACYLARRMYLCCKSNTLKIIYIAYFQTVI